MKKYIVAALCVSSLCCISVFGLSANAGNAADRKVYFGETHLHTALSFDSYVFGNRNLFVVVCSSTNLIIIH